MIGGVFWAGKRTGENKHQSPLSNPTLEQKITKIQNQLVAAKKQLANETDSDQKQKLEVKVKSLEQELTNLKNTKNPSPPSQNPPKTKRQFTVENNGAVGGKWEFINVDNPPERILIDSKNKIFYSNVAFYIKGDKYTISFDEENAIKKGNNFLFDQNNNKFQLTPTTSPSPGNQGPSNNSNDKIELEVKWNGELKNDYWLFTNSDWPVTRKRFHIAKNHPIFKRKKISYESPETPFNSPNPIPNFQLSFLKKDASKGDDNMDDGEYFFDENNRKFTLTPLGNWPDEPGQTPPPPGNNNPPPTKQKVIWKLEYKGPITAEFYNFEIKSAGGLGQGINIKQNHPSLHGFLLRKGNQYRFSFWTENPQNAFSRADSIFYENEAIELVEE